MIFVFCKAGATLVNVVLAENMCQIKQNFHSSALRSQATCYIILLQKAIPTKFRISIKYTLKNTLHGSINCTLQHGPIALQTRILIIVDVIQVQCYRKRSEDLLERFQSLDQIQK